MSSNVEVNAAAAQLVIARQALEQAKERHPEDADLISTLEDLHEAALRLYGWLRTLQGAGQNVLMMYTEFVTKFYKG